MSTTVTYKGSTLTTVTNQTRTLTTQGKYLEDNITLVDVTSGSSPTLQNKTVSPSTSQQTVQADSGYDGLDTVTVNAMPSGTAGTPTATKGSVSNHSVSVTPSVTNTTGYITGSTKTGTAVTVSASELVSGSETKTANGTYDVTNLAELVVNVSGGGGASNVVTGTFKGTTTGTAMDVTLNYTGSGYPVAVMIYPTEGPYNNTTGSFYSLVQRYVLQSYVCIKQSTNTTPTYPSSSTSDAENMSVYLCRYKSSSSSATAYQTTGGNIGNYRDTNSADSTSRYVMIRSKTKMSVFIASTSYGFAANIEHKYWVLYSS